MRFKKRLQLVAGSRPMYGAKLAETTFLSSALRLDTNLTVYRIEEPDTDSFIVTTGNSLGLRIEYSATSLHEVLEWLGGSRCWLPKEAVGQIIEKLAEQPKRGRGRPAGSGKPKVSYATRRRRDGSELTVVVGRGL